ncbi:hypothetical protein GGR54DRAFT_332599 [Hypoxylon sp. NC1633]|nr:hypothetical protein GGR54DRAFT_332599 [Hypoxylon sp. NC1633]
MNSYALTTGALLGVAPQINFGSFANNYSSATEPSALLNNRTVSFFDSSTVHTADLTTRSTMHGITTHVIVDIVLSGGVTASENSTSQQQADSVPPRITIDTVLASLRPQKITQVESETTTTPTTAALPSAT